MVNFEGLCDGARLLALAATFRRFQCRLDQSGNTPESKPTMDKFAYRDLVGGVEDRRSATSGCKCAACNRQCGNPHRIWFFEAELADLSQIEPRCRGRHASRPGETM